MICIQRFVVNLLEENCYVVHDAHTREAFIIDCGAYSAEERTALTRYVADKALHITHLLNTHSHFDHIFGAQFIFDTYGIRPEMHRLELPAYGHANEQIRTFLHRDMHIALPEAGPTFDDNATFPLGSTMLKALPTPGHTPGGVSFYAGTEGVLFSGDSLFRHSIGRTDFPGGNGAQLVRCLQERVLTLPDDVTVLPGHGPQTTIGEERQNNPYLA